jgi:hypothetical protein
MKKLTLATLGLATLIAAPAIALEALERRLAAVTQQRLEVKRLEE